MHLSTSLGGSISKCLERVPQNPAWRLSGPLSRTSSTYNVSNNPLTSHLIGYLGQALPPLIASLRGTWHHSTRPSAELPCGWFNYDLTALPSKDALWLGVFLTAKTSITKPKSPVPEPSPIWCPSSTASWNLRALQLFLSLLDFWLLLRRERFMINRLLMKPRTVFPKDIRPLRARFKSLFQGDHLGVVCVGCTCWFATGCRASRNCSAK